jgi:hypothetical protein
MLYFYMETSEKLCQFLEQGRLSPHNEHEPRALELFLQISHADEIYHLLSAEDPVIHRTFSSLAIQALVHIALMYRFGSKNDALPTGSVVLYDMDLFQAWSTIAYERTKRPYCHFGDKKQALDFERELFLSARCLDRAAQFGGSTFEDFSVSHAEKFGEVIFACGDFVPSASF